MTDLTQSNWYDEYQNRVDFLGHTEPRRNDELQKYLRLGGKLSEYPFGPHPERFSRESNKQCANVDSVLSLEARIDRALGLTPQMEKAEHVST